MILTATNLHQNSGAKAIGNARTVECPRCFARSGKRCVDTKGHEQSANHVERAKVARYTEMLEL